RKSRIHPEGTGLVDDDLDALDVVRFADDDAAGRAVPISSARAVGGAKQGKPCTKNNHAQGEMSRACAAQSPHSQSPSPRSAAIPVNIRAWRRDSTPSPRRTAYICRAMKPLLRTQISGARRFRFSSRAKYDDKTIAAAS